jgi:hypothetical protein
MCYKTLHGAPFATMLATPQLLHLIWDQTQRSWQPILKGTVNHELRKFSISCLYTSTIPLCGSQKNPLPLCYVSTDGVSLVLSIYWYIMLSSGTREERIRWGQDNKRSAISCRSNLFWAASITPLHSALTRTSLMIAAACPVGSSDVLLNINICTTMRQHH